MPCPGWCHRASSATRLERRSVPTTIPSGRSRRWWSDLSRAQALRHLDRDRIARPSATATASFRSAERLEVMGDSSSARARAWRPRSPRPGPRSGAADRSSWRRPTPTEGDRSGERADATFEVLRPRGAQSVAEIEPFPSVAVVLRHRATDPKIKAACPLEASDSSPLRIARPPQRERGGCPGADLGDFRQRCHASISCWPCKRARQPQGRQGTGQGLMAA